MPGETPVTERPGEMPRCLEHQRLVLELSEEIHKGFTIVESIREAVERLEKIVIFGNASEALTQQIKVIAMRVDQLRVDFDKQCAKARAERERADETKHESSVQSMEDRRTSRRLTVLIVICVISSLVSIATTLIKVFWSS